MATALYVSAFSTTIAASLTNYFYNGQGGGTSNGSTESFVAVVNRAPGTYSNLYIRITANDRGTSTGRMRVNAANGNQSVSITGTGEFEDTSNTDAVVAGDKTCYSITTGAGGTTFIPTVMSCKFAATTNTITRFAITAASTNTTFQPLAGVGSTSGTETNTQFKVKTSGTFKNLFVTVSANTRDGTATYRLRKNAANGNSVISVTTLSTGDFEDTSNTDAVVSGDLVNYSFSVAGTTGTVTARAQAIDFENTNSKFLYMASSTVTPITLTTSTTTFFPVAGNLNLNNTGSETDASVKTRLAHTISNLACLVTANTVTATSTLRSRINGSNGNQAASITTSTTGYFEDTSNSDTVLSTDEINVSLTTGATGTSLALRNTAMIGTNSSGTTGEIKVYSGAAFVAKPVKVYNGTSFVVKPLKVYNGVSFVPTNY